MSDPSTEALSRELSHFLVELRVALHKHAIYPDSHPALRTAVTSLTRRLVALLRDRSTVAIGVARYQLVIEGIATDASSSLLRELADSFHRHRLSVVKFLSGIREDELSSMLKALATDPDRSGQRLGSAPAQERALWPHVRLYRQSFDQLELVDGGHDQSAVGEGAARAAQLWLGLARAALAAKDTEADESLALVDPATVAKAIDEHSHELAYDQAIVAYLLEIAAEVKKSGGSTAGELQLRVAQLVRALPGRTLRRLLGMGGDVAQRHRFVIDASHGMAADTVLTLVRTAAESSQRSISDPLMRLLTKLAIHAETGSPSARSEADAAMREQVQHLVAGWSLEQPNPPGHRAGAGVLPGASTQAQAQAAPFLACEAERILAMGLEVDVLGGTVLQAADTVVAQAGVRRCLELLDAAPNGCTATAVLASRCASPEQLSLLLREDPIDVDFVDRLVALAGLAAAEPLLDALASAHTRATRRKVLERLERLGPGIASIVAARLPGAPWYVQRNLLLLMARSPNWPPGFSPAAYTTHPDERVRYEALKILLRVPHARDLVICQALGDSSERVLRLALTSALQGCPAGAVSRVASHATDPRADPEVRVLAIRVIATVKSANSLELLLRLVLAGKRLFRRRKLAPRSPEMLAALEGLATHWSTEPKARAVLAMARGEVELRRVSSRALEVPSV